MKTRVIQFIALSLLIAIGCNQPAHAQKTIPQDRDGLVTPYKDTNGDKVDGVIVEGGRRGVVEDCYLRCAAAPTNGRAGFTWSELPKDANGRTLLSGLYDLHCTVHSPNPDLKNLWMSAELQTDPDDKSTITITKSFEELNARRDSRVKDGQFEFWSHSSLLFNEPVMMCSLKSLTVFSTSNSARLLGRPGIIVYHNNGDIFFTPAKIKF